VVTGDAELDRRFLVNAPSPEAARAFLDRRRRQLLLQLDDAPPGPWCLCPDGLVVAYGTEWDHDDQAGAALLSTMAGWAKALLT
jgi:hypothetical protein